MESLRCAAASGAATVLALVISVGAPNVAKQVAAAAAVLQAVGPSGPSHAMVVLTHADAMNLDCALLPSYLATAPSALQVQGPCDPLCLPIIILVLVRLCVHELPTASVVRDRSAFLAHSSFAPACPSLLLAFPFRTEKPLSVHAHPSV